jgi:chromosome segregation ATPase
MARGRVYKSEVKAARDALLIQGINPSLDAVRIALGNTGSKTTIHRLMKELEAEEKTAIQLSGDAVSDALQALVQHLATQLRTEAEAVVTDGQARAETMIATARGEAVELKTQLHASSDQVHRLEVALAEMRASLAVAENTVRQRDTAIAGLQERIAGLERQMVDRKAHLTSIEAKHQQARDALAHFRLASKEQRELEGRQHEQALQALQVELRRATEALSSKNDELLSLNRDNARLTEQASQHSKDARELKREIQDTRERANQAKIAVERNDQLERRVTELTLTLESTEREYVDATARWAAERASHVEAMREAQMYGERWNHIESVLATLQSTHDAPLTPGKGQTAP